MPWTKEKIDELNATQKSGKFHPYTCDRKSEKCEVNISPRDYTKDGVLIATEEGWICPCGNYRQNLSH
jgi:hypothetical protein